MCKVVFKEFRRVFLTVGIDDFLLFWGVFIGESENYPLYRNNLIC